MKEQDDRLAASPTRPIDRRRSLWARLVPPLIVLCLLGCWVYVFHVRFDMSVVDVAVTDQGSSAAPIHKGSSEAIVGSQIALRVSTDIDLERLAPRLTHHLYFRLFVAGQSDSIWALWSGGVLRGEAGNAIDSVGKHVYEVRIPTDVGRLIDHARGYGSVDIEAYAALAKSGHLRLSIGGAKMWGEASLFGEVDVPLAIQGDRLVVR